MPYVYSAEPLRAAPEVPATGRVPRERSGECTDPRSSSDCRERAPLLVVQIEVDVRLDPGFESAGGTRMTLRDRGGDASNEPKGPRTVADPHGTRLKARTGVAADAVTQPYDLSGVPD